MKYLGIDYGDSKTGVAVSDELGMFATPVEVIRTRNQDVLIRRLTELSEEHKTTEIVVGLPIGLKGESRQTAKVKAFAEDLTKHGFTVHFWDESYSTKKAEKGARGRKRKEADMEAARIILQEYLEEQELLN